MTKSLKTKQNSDALYWFLLISCWLIYVLTIVAKSIYNAEIIEVMKEFDISKSVAGYVSTAYYR